MIMRNVCSGSTWLLLIGMVVVLAPRHPCAASTMLAHYEFQCLDAAGCTHSVRTATEANFGIEVFPDRVDFRGFAPGETADITVLIDSFLVEFLTSGSLSTPEPMEFLAVMVSAGGRGQTVDKSDLLAGIDRNDPVVRVDAAYDVPLANGIDLQGTARLTDLRFQLLNLEILDSNVLAGSALRAHYRFEFLGHVIPEPASWLIGMLGAAMICCRRRRRPVHAAPLA